MFGRSDRLEGIIATFTKTLDKLDVLVSDNMARIDTNAAQIKSLEIDNDSLSRENEKALSVRGKISALVE